MSNVVRLISASKSDFETMTPMDLKESIYKSEGRVIMGQYLLFAGAGLVRGVTNSELMFAFGSDMVLLNTIDLDNWDNNPGLQGLTYQELKARCGQRPIGVYLGCPKAGSEDGGKKALYRREGMLCTPEHVQKCVDMGVDFVILCGIPGSGTSITDVVDCTKWVKEKYGDKLFVFAGKWEDGINEKVLGDPLAQYDAKDNLLSPATLFGLNSIKPLCMLTLQDGSINPMPSATELPPKAKLHSSYHPPGLIFDVQALISSQSVSCAPLRLNHSPRSPLKVRESRTISTDSVFLFTPL